MISFHSRRLRFAWIIAFPEGKGFAGDEWCDEQPKTHAPSNFLCVHSRRLDRGRRGHFERQRGVAYKVDEAVPIRALVVYCHGDGPGGRALERDAALLSGRDARFRCGSI